MSKQLKISDFSAGWIPSDDKINGRKNGLLRMEGGTLDENGALVMANGTKKIAFQYPANAHTIFSRFVCGERRRYLALEDGSVYRNETEIVSTGVGSTTRAAFGVFGDFVLIASGSEKIKDICDVGTGSLGLIAPDEAIDVTPINTTLDVTPLGTLSNFQAVGAAPGSFSVVDDVISLTTASLGSGNYLEAVYNDDTSDFPKDLSGSDEDVFRFSVKVDDTTAFITADNAANIYIKFKVAGEDTTYDVLVGGQDLQNALTLDEWHPIEIKRSDIGKTGPDPYAWAQIDRVGITVLSEEGTAVTYSFKDFSFGGVDEEIQGELNGTYTWVQVNVYRTAGFVTKSDPSPVSDAHEVALGYANIIPYDPTITEPLANEVWFYRRGGDLPDYYRVGTMSYDELGTFDDVLSDADVLALGERLNESYITVADGITDDILEIVGPVHDRTLYFTDKEVHFSDISNPDVIDPDRSLNTTGSEAETFFWARQVAENVVLIGTLKDVYVLSGTWETDSDGVIDVDIKPLGIDHPPICRDVAVYKGSVAYFTSRGWALVSLGNDYVTLVNPSTRLLYDGVQRYEYDGVPIAVEPEYRYSLVIAKDKLYCATPTITDYTDTSTREDSSSWGKRLEVYDFLQKYWRPFNYCPILLAVEEDGKILGFFDDMRLGEIDHPFSKLLNFVES